MTSQAVVHRPTSSVLVNADDPLMLRQLLPRSKTIQMPGFNVAVQHTLESVKILRNIGIQVPAPILTNYSWPGKYRPFAHQRVMAEFLTMNRRCFNLSEMGAGKTAATLWAIDWLIDTGRVRKTLILTPLSTMDRVWRSDAFDVLMHRKVSIVYGTKEKRLKALEADAEIFILNHDGLMVQAVVDAVRKDPEFDLIVVDEASVFRNHGTKKYRQLKELVRPDMRLWMLTGTPCPNAPTDAWALARLVSPQRVPKFFGAFKRQTMMQMSQFKWVPQLDSYKKAFDALQPAVRFRKEDCLDLPPVTFLDRQAEMTKEQRKAFDEMRKHMRVEAAASTVTAANAADKINKIRQIFCGAIKDPETEKYVPIPHAGRYSVLEETIEQASAKVIVVVPFKGIIYELQRQLESRWSVGLLNGDVPVRRRDQIIRDFKETPDPHILLCHPKVMAHGLNLTEADTLIFYAPIYSNDEYLQVIERFNRTGQTRKMTVVRIATHPIEWQIYKLVDSRGLTQSNILSLYHEIAT